MLSKRWALVAASLLAAGGCAHCRPQQNSGYGYDASYGYPPEGAMSAAPAIPQEKSYVDRHPLLSSPRNYYRDSGDNAVVKVLAGTFIGVPVGIAKEAWQIGYGQ